jgi:hypothetical protein
MSDGSGVRNTVHGTLLELSDIISVGRSHLSTYNRTKFTIISQYLEQFTTELKLIN